MGEDRPIFLVIADELATDILAGTYPEDTQVPSIAELAVFYRVNPATAARALTRLVEDGIVYKRRGLGMFVAPGAPATLRDRRIAAYAGDFVRPLVDEGTRLGFTGSDILDHVRKELP